MLPPLTPPNHVAFQNNAVLLTGLQVPSSGSFVSSLTLGVYVFTLSESRYIDPSGGARPARGRPLTHLGNLELKRILFQLRCVNRTPLCGFIET